MPDTQGTMPHLYEHRNWVLLSKQKPAIIKSFGRYSLESDQGAVNNIRVPLIALSLVLHAVY